MPARHVDITGGMIIPTIHTADKIGTSRMTTIDIESEGCTLGDSAVAKPTSTIPQGFKPTRVVLERKRDSIGPATPQVCIGKARIEASRGDRGPEPGCPGFIIHTISQCKNVTYGLEPIG